MGPEGDERRALARKNALGHRWIAGAGRQERTVARWGYTRMADLRASTTDPDASPMHHKNKSSGRLGYLTHYVVDGGKARVVLGVLVTGAEVTENLPMLEMLFRSRFRWRLKPRSVTGDAAYGTRENIAAIEKVSIRAYAALAEQGKRTSLFTIEDFAYDAQRDLYICPAGRSCAARATTAGRVRKVRRADGRLRRVPPKEQVHEQPEGTMGEPQPRGGVPRKGQGVSRHRALPQGPTQTRGVGRAAVRGGQGVARIEEVQAKATRGGERRGTHGRRGAKRQAARGLRSRTPEEDRDGGGPASARHAIPIPDPPTSHEPSVAFFNTLGNSQKLNFRFTEFSDVWLRCLAHS